VTRRRKVLTTALQVVALAIAVGGSVAYVWRSIDLAALRHTLSAGRSVPLSIAAALVVPAAFARTAYWKALLDPVRAVPFRVLLGYTLACNASNALLPARGGDAMRVWLLRKRHDVPLRVAGAIVAMEKAGDVLALGVLVAPLPWLLPELPTAVSHALRIILAIVVVVIALVAIARRQSGRLRWLADLEAVHRPAVLLRGFRMILLVWLLDLASVLLVMSAVRMSSTIASALLVLLFVNLAIAIPASPGQIGAHELGAVTALRIQGVAPEQAVAFALLYHGVQLVPVLLMGLLDARTTLRWRRIASESDAASDVGTAGRAGGSSRR
jgi:glycosyltransferase 2 family protein